MPQSPLAAMIAQSVKTKALALLQLDGQGAAPVAQSHAKLYSPTAAGRVFSAANATGATTSAGLATTYVGLCISNPAASGKNLSLIRVSGSLNVAPAALTGYGLITGFVAGGVTVHTTPVTPLGAIVGAAAGVGLADAACTLVGTPAWALWFAETPTATGVFSFSADLDGSILIPPGGYAAIGSTIAGSASGLLGSFVWEEVPV